MAAKSYAYSLAVVLLAAPTTWAASSQGLMPVSQEEAASFWNAGDSSAIGESGELPGEIASREEAIALDATEEAIAEPPELETEDGMEQVNAVSQLSDVRPTDWAFQALQSLVERYGCIAGYPDSTYRGNRAMSRYEFAAALNACLNRIEELIGTGSPENLATREDLALLQRLLEEFSVEIATLRGRVDGLEARAAELEANQFSTTTKLNGEIIWALTDAVGDRVGRNSDESNAILAYRTRLNVETSFTGRDLLRTRLEYGNFAPVADATGTNMTRLNFDTATDNQVTLPHLLYSFPLSDAINIIVGPSGVGYPDITDLLVPPGVADDARGIPSLFGEYNPFYRRGGGGGAVNWSIAKNLTLTLGYVAGNASNPSPGNGFFNGQYNALAQLAYRGERGAIGAAYSRSYSPAGQGNITGGAGSFLSQQPFGDNIATSSDSFSLQGFYRISPKFQIHAWGTYARASAETSGLSNISDGRGGEFSTFVADGSEANIWYGAVGLTFPDFGGEGNLSGILVGLPPRVTGSDVRRERDTSYHLEVFYRFQVNDNISITPAFWVIGNPENNSSNATQYVGVIRTGFNF